MIEIWILYIYRYVAYLWNLQNLVQAKEGHCVWYNQCGSDPNNGDKIINCHYEGPAKTLHDKAAVAELKQLCPQYITNGSKYW